MENQLRRSGRRPKRKRPAPSTPASAVWRRPAAPGRRGPSPQDGDEVQRLVQRPLAQREVGCRDRRREAVVEALGEAELGVYVVPPGPERELVGAQLSG